MSCKNLSTNVLGIVERVVNDYDLDQMQYDALWDLLSDNPLLPSSGISSKNKALKTQKQNVIGAINELLDKIKSTDDNVRSFDSSFKTSLGDIGSIDKEQWEILQQIDTNVVRAIVKIWTEMGGLESDLDISDIGATLKEAIRNLNDKFNNHETRITALEQGLGSGENPAKIPVFVRETPTYDLEQPNCLFLSRTPNERDVILKVNGLEYDENDDFTVDRVERKLTWTCTLFNLDLESDEFDVNYFVEE